MGEPFENPEEERDIWTIGMGVNYGGGKRIKSKRKSKRKNLKESGKIQKERIRNLIKKKQKICDEDVFIMNKFDIFIYINS